MAPSRENSPMTRLPSFGKDTRLDIRTKSEGGLLAELRQSNQFSPLPVQSMAPRNNVTESKERGKSDDERNAGT